MNMSKRRGRIKRAVRFKRIKGASADEHHVVIFPEGTRLGKEVSGGLGSLETSLTVPRGQKCSTQKKNSETRAVSYREGLQSETPAAEAAGASGRGGGIDKRGVRSASSLRRSTSGGRRG